MIGVILVFTALAMYIIAFKTNVIGKRKPVTGPATPKMEISKKKFDPEKEFSWPAAHVWKHFDRLPESHRPSYDIVASLKALDVKYGFRPNKIIPQHFINGTYNQFDPMLGCGVNIHQGDINCACVNPNHEFNEYHDDDYDEYSEECSMYPEYLAMYSAIDDIFGVLNEQRRLEDARERQIELAGIQNDLENVEAITAALRAERDLINDVNKEII